MIVTPERLADSRAGRLVLVFAAGGLVIQAVRALRGVVEIVQTIDGPRTPDLAPCAVCAHVVDAEAPAPAATGDPTPGLAGE